MDEESKTLEKTRYKMTRNETIDLIRGNLCIECGQPVNEDLRKWFKQKWVNIGKKDKSGKHPECGTSGEKRGYAKCVPASKAAGMSKKQKASATRRKRAAQNKAGRGGRGKQGAGAQGRKPIRVSTKSESVNEDNSWANNKAMKKADVAKIIKKDLALIISGGKPRGGFNGNTGEIFAWADCNSKRGMRYTISVDTVQDALKEL